MGKAYHGKDEFLQVFWHLGKIDVLLNATRKNDGNDFNEPPNSF